MDMDTYLTLATKLNEEIKHRDEKSKILYGEDKAHWDLVTSGMKQALLIITKTLTD